MTDRPDSSKIPPLALPELPAPIERLLDPGLPAGDWTIVGNYARSHGLALLLSEPAVWAVGVGHDGAGGPALAYVVDTTANRAAVEGLPQTITTEGRTFPVVAVEATRNVRPQMGNPAITKYAGALTGCLASVDRTTLELANTTSPAAGTLSGVFPPLVGGGRRAVTNAHVALGVDAETLFSDLLAHFYQLFKSPSGQRVLAYDDHDFRFGAYELFRVDTPWPILVPIPFALLSSFLSSFSFTLSGGPLTGAALSTLVTTLSAGPLGPLLSSLTSLLGVGGLGLPNIFGSAPLTFQYVDVAAGRVNPKAIPGSDVVTPPPPPPSRRTVRGRDLSLGHTLPPGSPVYAIGTALDLRWGTLAMAGTTIRFDLVLPSGLLGAAQSILGSTWSPPPALVFNVNLYAMDISPGDSGMTAISKWDDAPNGICGLGLGGTMANPKNWLTMGTPNEIVQLFGKGLM